MHLAKLWYFVDLYGRWKGVSLANAQEFDYVMIFLSLDLSLLISREYTIPMALSVRITITILRLSDIFKSLATIKLTISASLPLTPYIQNQIILTVQATILYDIMHTFYLIIKNFRKLISFLVSILIPKIKT